MSETKESSVVFSLQELATMEEARIAEEAAAAVAAEAQARADEEARAQEYEWQLAEAEEAARTQELQERALFEATVQSELEKARLEVEHRARMEVLDADLNHREHVAFLKHDAVKKRLKQATIALATTLGFFVLLGVFVWSEISAKNANLSFQLQRVEAEYERLTDTLSQRESTIRRLQTELDDALAHRDEGPVNFNAEMVPPKRNYPPPLNRVWGQPKPCKPCPPGDPLCPCLY